MTNGFGSDWPPPSQYDDPNDWFNTALVRTTDHLINCGIPREDALATTVQSMVNMLDASAPDHAVGLEENGQEFIVESAEYRREFAERLRTHWGNALDLFELVIDIVAQSGNLCARRNIGHTDDRDLDLLIDVLAQLNGQAVRVAHEVHTLLSAGFPLGAHALARTLHEISVRAAVLAEYGVAEDHKDLAERFLRHADVLKHKDAKVYQRDAADLGYEPLADETLETLQAVHDELIEKYGDFYDSSYGWASGLPGLSGRPSFERLEHAAALGHHRGFYKWGSHFVHADARSLDLSMVERGGSRAVLTNATNTMLADPGRQALHSLYRVYVSLATAADPFAFYDQLVCRSLRHLIDKADQHFVDGEASVDDAEERLQAELAERGLRYDIVLGEVPLDDLTPPA